MAPNDIGAFTSDLTCPHVLSYCPHMPPVEMVRSDGPKIRQLIKANGYSVSGFGRAIGRHPQTMSDIVRGRLPSISIPLLFEIARGLHVEPRVISDYADDDESEPAAKIPA